MVYLYIIFVTSHKTDKNKYQTSSTLKVIAKWHYPLNKIEFCLFDKTLNYPKLHKKGSRNIFIFT